MGFRKGSAYARGPVKSAIVGVADLFALRGVRRSRQGFQRLDALPEVERLTSLSRDSLTRHHKDKIVALSPRRRGMKLRDALAIANGGAT